MHRIILGYLKLTIKHIIRSALISIPVIVIAGFAGALIAAVFDLIFVDLLHFSFSLYNPTGVLILCSILGLAVSIFMVFILCSGDYTSVRSFEGDGKCFKVSAYDTDTTEFKYPRSMTVKLHLWLYFFVASGIIAWQFIIHYDALVAGFDESVMSMAVFLICPIMLTTQIIYLYWGRLNYVAATCENCKHIFCMNEQSTPRSRGKTYEYSETTRREKIGSIGSVDVHADVTRGKVTTVYHSTKDLHHTCCNCGYKYDSIRTDSYKR